MATPSPIIVRTYKAKSQEAAAKMNVGRRWTRVIWIVIGVSVITLAPLVASPSAKAATCASAVGPGIPPPSGVTFGNAGFHAAWFGQSGYMSLCPGTESTATVAYYNTGSRGWVNGRLGEVAYLATWNPTPGQDQASILGGDGTQGSPDTGWPRFNRLAVQPAPYVGPGQVAWFQFRVRAPATPGRYTIALRPVIEGTTWMEDYGVFWFVTVLNLDGSVPPVPLSFGSGTKRVGTDISAGTYRTRSASSGCYWTRLSGFGGTFAEIKANGLTDDPEIVTIDPSDTGFDSTRCATWTNDLSPITSSLVAPFQNGAFIVRVDIAAGTWRAPASSGCYWSRVSGFSGTFSDIIANGLTDSDAIVAIASGDKGFRSSRCGRLNEDPNNALGSCGRAPGHERDPSPTGEPAVALLGKRGLHHGRSSAAGADNPATQPLSTTGSQPTLAAAATPTEAPKPTAFATSAVRLPAAEVAAAATVLIDSPAGHGSGVYMGSNRVLTAAHVVTGRGPFTVSFRDLKVNVAVITSIDLGDDLALLSVAGLDGSGAAAMTWGDVGQLRLGDHLTVVGYPEFLLGSPRHRASFRSEYRWRD